MANTYSCGLWGRSKCEHNIQKYTTGPYIWTQSTFAVCDNTVLITDDAFDLTKG